jgi:hypothetical protein
MELDLLLSPRAADLLVELELGELAPDPSLAAGEFQLVRLAAAHRDRADAVDTAVLAACKVDWDSAAFALADILAQDTESSPWAAAH